MLTIVFQLHYGPEADALTSNNGQGLQDPTVNLIFAGNWTPYAASEASIINAIQTIVTGPYLTGLAQYSTSGTATMGAVGFNTTQFIPTLLNNSPNNAELQSYVQQSISTFGLPTPPSGDAEHAPIYIVIVNPADWKQSTAGTVYSGFNIPGTYNSTPIHMILTSTIADGSNKVSIDNLTTTVSHELAERSVNNAQLFHVPSGEAAASNGVYTTGANVQVCDGEMDPSVGPYLYRLGGYLVQAYWSDLNVAAIVPNVTYSSSAADYVLVPTWSGTAWARTYQMEILLGSVNVPVAFSSSQGSNPVETIFSVSINGQTATFGASDDPMNFVYVDAPTHVTIDDTNSPTPSSLTIGNSNQILFDGWVGGFFPSASIEINFSDSVTSALEVDASRLDGNTVHVVNTVEGVTTTVNAVGGASTVNVDRVQIDGPLVLNLGNTTQTVNISPSTEDYSKSIFADVSINAASGLATLNVRDDADTGSRRWTIDAGSISSDIIGAGMIHYGRLFAVTLFGGTNGNTFVVQNTYSGLTTSLWTVYSDTVNVLGTGPFSTLNVKGNARIINVGNAGRTADVHGLVSIDVIQGALSIDDSADLLGQNDVVVTSSSIIGLTDRAIGFYSSGLTALAIRGSHGGSTYHVLGTPNFGSSSPTTTTLTCEGTDIVDVGDNGSLADVQGDLLVTNPSKSIVLNIDASAQMSSAAKATITNAAVTGLSAGAIRFDQSALAALYINGEQGGTTYDILSLPAYFLVPITTTLNAIAGDTVNLGQHGSLQNVWGNASLVCSFSGAGAAAHVVLDGSRDPAGAQYTIGGNGNLTVFNQTVGLSVTVNGFRGVDEIDIDLPGGSLYADVTHTGPGTISLDGTARLMGTNVAAPNNVIVHARQGAVTMQPTGANNSVLKMYNTLDLLGSRPQDNLDAYDSNNNIAISSNSIPASYAQFATATGDPTTATAGQPFDFTVIAQDVSGATLTNYTNQVQWYAYNQTTRDYFSSNYEPFAPADQGQHVFHGLVLPDAGTYSLGFDDGWNASSFTITVLASAGGHLDGQVGGSSAPANIAAGTIAAEPAAVTSDALATTLPVDVSIATMAVVSDPVAKLSLAANSVAVTAVVPNPVETAPQQTTAAIATPVDGSASGRVIITSLIEQGEELPTPRTEPALSRSSFSTDVARQLLPDVQTLAACCAIDPRTNPGGSSDSIMFRSTQPAVVVQSPANDAMAAVSCHLPSSECVGSARFETRDVTREIGSRAAVIRPDSSLTLPIASDWTDALDECFAQYDGLLPSSKGSSCASEM
jgi:hypothetical protein